MIKVEEKQYSVRETPSTNGAKSYRPEKSKEDCCDTIVWLIVWDILLSLGVIFSLCISIK